MDKFNERDSIEFTIRAAKLGKAVMDMVAINDIHLARLMLQRTGTEYIELTDWLKSKESANAE